MPKPAATWPSLGLAAFLVACSACHAGELPAQATQLLPKGDNVMTFASGDLNADGKTDYVVVVRSNSKDTLVQSGALAQRPLMVLLQTEGSGFKVIGFAQLNAGALGRQLDCTKGVITMAGVFGKDPNMKRSGGREELDRIMDERRRKQALAAAMFRQKKPAASPDKPAPDSKK